MTSREIERERRAEPGAGWIAWAAGAAVLAATLLLIGAVFG